MPRVIAFDCETYLIQDTEKAPKPVISTWCDGEKTWLTHPGDAWTLQLWADPDNVFVGQNIPYDIITCMRWHPHLIPHMVQALDEGRVYDTQMRENIKYLAEKGAAGYNPKINLAELVNKYLGIDISASKKGDDIWRLKYGTLDGVPYHEWPKEALDYALQDALYTWRVFQSQGGLSVTHPTEGHDTRASVVLHAIGVRGHRIDQQIRAKLKTGLEADIAPLAEKVNAFGWKGEGSQKRIQEAAKQAWFALQTKAAWSYCQITGVQVDQAIFAQMTPGIDLNAWGRTLIENNQYFPWARFPVGLDPLMWMKEVLKYLPEIPMNKKGISVSEESLEPLAASWPDAKGYIEYKHLNKMLSTYIEPYVNETVHASFVPLVSTGRTGCRVPNTQNVPRKDKERPNEAFRTMFVARPGMKLGTVDYSQLELCTLSATIREFFNGMPCAMGDAIDKGLDLHCITGSLVTGFPYEQMMANKKKEGSPEAKARQASKAVNFGKPGGLMHGSFMAYAKNNYGVDVDFEQTNRLFSAFNKAWPEVPRYLDMMKKRVDADPSRRTAGVSLSGRVKANLSYTELANYHFQELAATGAKVSLWMVWRECVLGDFWKRQARETVGYGKEYGDMPLRDSALVNFVHDEIVGEHPPEDPGKQALKRQEHLMVAGMTWMCKNLITIRVEGNLSDQWEH